MRGFVFFTTFVLLTVLTSAVVHAEEEEAPNPGLFGTSFLEGWKRSVAIGISGTNGNTDEVKTIADISGEYEDESHRRKLIAQYYLSDTDTGPTERKAFTEYEENWKPFQNSFFVFGIGRYDFDRLEAWDHRIAASGGLGSEIIATEELQVRFSVGGGVNHTWDGSKDTIPEGVVRLGGDYIIAEDVTFGTTHTYYPNFDDTSEYRVISDAELKADIGEKGGVSVSIGVVNEYDSLAEDENNDLRYFLRLRYDI